MKLASRLVGIAAALVASQAAAENWVTVIDDEEYEMWASVDKDSIRRGADNLVYYTSNNGAGKGDHASDCNSRTSYTLKLYVMGGIDYPNWRNDGSSVVSGSIGDAVLQYVCANS